MSKRNRRVLTRIKNYYIDIFTQECISYIVSYTISQYLYRALRTLHDLALEETKNEKSRG